MRATSVVTQYSLYNGKSFRRQLCFGAASNSRQNNRENNTTAKCTNVLLSPMSQSHTYTSPPQNSHSLKQFTHHNAHTTHAASTKILL
jgi:hypothetical protein